ncbi:erythromycin biosynthesis sensory transduction protein eryC1 [Chromobacterium sp. Panama]|uniref:DegT/DnrJ/EryC1/StrS family aminotransferase n=1 Tax=Chromobacterium sp. Panama TaxID=2161826 RepID=UPI000D3086E8|nr:DegT/DnrJ/EryC1/StrS family aminotransferase [Chromobacterium sp. Panama]PTU67285.1 erythromycin biosynthesis sensory transduction protein eryC1 [Chromobacterium sp. Panama]
MSRVPFLDLSAAYHELRDELEDALLRAARSGFYIGGEEVALFERAFAAHSGSAHCIGVGNGLDALRLSLLALEAGPGDEVIVPSNTFIATWLAVSQCGATLVPVEPNPDSHLITADGIAAALTPRTKVILPVHLYGQPAEMGPIMDLARRHGVKVVADAAQAHGARYRGQAIGGLADLSTWSFYPSKNLGALGDGGAVTTNDPILAERVRMLGNYGSREKYLFELPGMNSRLDPLQAAVLRVKLTYLEEWNARRQRIAQRYIDELSNGEWRLPNTAADADPVWHLFVLRHPQRDVLQRQLRTQGVETLIHYPLPPHRQQAYRGAWPADAFPVANQLSAEVLSLPIGPQLSDDHVSHVIRCLPG